MAERIHPASKPPTLNPPPARAALNGTTNGNGNGNGNPAFPPTKSQLYGANRPTYRPQPKPKPRRNRRSCCCACFLWTTLVIIVLLLLGAIGSGVLYVIYRPHRPSFTLTTLKFNQLNITTSKDDSSKLNSKIDLSVVARNPNKELVFLYDQIHVSVFTNGIDVGDGSFNGFVHGTKNTTVLKSLISTKDRDLVDPASAKALSTDLKKKGTLFFNVELNTKVGVKISGKKMKKFGIQVKCDQIKAIYVVPILPKGNSTSNSTTNSTMTTIWRLSESSVPKCKVNLRIKIWKFTF